ncbi:universal stress protein [Aestuariivirga sp.]|uniref:universal stress protein n=1 Tax=Aestuariivirga sp. TaxID=2650926 RepID=UPI0025BD2C2F|nr:universal stress protein [Aestuariivirga sp.]
MDKPPEREAEASDAPIVAAAVNLDDMTPELAEKLRRALLRIMERSPDARLAVLNVLKLNQGRITYHVLEAVDPAEKILDYARVNNVDHIVMGARANSTMRKILGSVSGKVAMEAPCTVTVVRVRDAEA